MKVSIYTDGGSRGNPGHSGFGVVILDESGHTLGKISKYIGIATNNEAEYSALIAALSWVRDNLSVHQITSLNFYADSQLMVRQIQGVYKVKAANIRPLYLQATNLLTTLNLPYQFTDVRREFNSEADALANAAMDRKS